MDPEDIQMRSRPPVPVDDEPWLAWLEGVYDLIAEEQQRPRVVKLQVLARTEDFEGLVQQLRMLASVPISGPPFTAFGIPLEHVEAPLMPARMFITSRVYESDQQQGDE
ncbi:hypothetical protein RN607_00625 [Demequina capsici]|uniref:Uncharacterized protein n=1 Tax=Demequina capsici TaxID=3075620 RepID=A0AA96J9Q8_9MICO|nr:hypothetical protein [Demequina sp. PMTSA13]WNM27537.1 hypothetical protein RN607_00625 [Demequina sp. PMTSA13]